MSKSFCATGVATFAATLLLASVSHADTFGSGENAFEIPFVTIGSPGNAPDTTGAPNPAGSVGYTYRIGKYEVPEEAIRKANELSALSGDPLGITLDDRAPQKPATRVSWFEAAEFVNWLNEDKGFSPAYKFDAQGEFQLWEPNDDGYNAGNRFRNRNARYVLPSVDEWYKAAFFDPQINDYWDYPTGSNDPPTPVESGTAPGTAVYNQAGPADVLLAGGESPNGTVAQAGNVWEWEESSVDLINDIAEESRGVRGFSHVSTQLGYSLSSGFRSQASANASIGDVGFRVVRVPEPSGGIVSLLTSFFILSRSRKK